MVDFNDNKGLKELWDVISGYMESVKLYYVLVAAVELSLFDSTIEPVAIGELSRKLSCDPVILEGVCEVLVESGFLEKLGDMYVNTDSANRYLVKRNPFSVCDAVESFSYDVSIWKRLPEILRNGPVKLSKGSFFARHVIHKMCVEAMCGELQRTLGVVCSIPAFRRARKMLDLGGGHGIYTVAFCSVNADMRGCVFDLPEVVEETEKYIRRFGLEDRICVLSGDFFRDDIGSGYDMVFSSYNPGGKNPEVVEKVYDALNSGGMFVSKQSFPVNRRNRRPIDELWWYVWTVDGMRKDKKMYSFKGDVSLDRYVAFLESVGFKVIRVDDFSDADKLVVARKEGN